MQEKTLHDNPGSPLSVLVLTPEEAVQVIRSLAGQLAGLPDDTSGSFAMRSYDEAGKCRRVAIILGPR